VDHDVSKMFFLLIALLIVLGYLIGSLPFGYIYSKYFMGVDVRNFGSHSTGSTNVLRAGGKKLAFVTLLSDAFKGVLTAYIGTKFSNNICFGMCIFCVIGHVYPLWLNFKGGKGAATTAGTFLFFEPFIALGCAVVWALFAKLTRKSSIASLAFCCLFVLITIARFLFGDIDCYMTLYAVVILIFLIFTHRENIKRILKHKELEV
jgi:glycerol-3-phosphate acyltransferase PlsY